MITANLVARLPLPSAHYCYNCAGIQGHGQQRQQGRRAGRARQRLAAGRAGAGAAVQQVGL